MLTMTTMMDIMFKKMVNVRDNPNEVDPYNDGDSGGEFATLAKNTCLGIPMEMTPIMI